MLEKHPRFPGIAGPVVTIVMDGIGVSDNPVGNAVLHAHTPTLDRLRRDYPYTTLRAHGTAVGMPSDADMGNSEVGHNAMGAGRVYYTMLSPADLGCVFCGSRERSCDQTANAQTITATSWR